jgi:phosphoribosylaminoimidazolecarboxamide formyltransferase/IMP cyclohydrolase
MFKHKNVIISVFDKTNLDVIANFLIDKNFTIYSTGGTSQYLKDKKIKHIEISNYTKQKEILGGRVKTLHPKIFGGLLGTSSQKHQQELTKEGIKNFDLLIINLYPFEETIKKTNNSKDIIEMIDIGGHSLIRAAVKNYEKTLTIVSPDDYQHFIKNYKTVEKLSKKFAINALRHITDYDVAITNWFEGKTTQKYPLRYGENPHQKAYANIEKNAFEQLSGEKKLSYNNILDLDAAINIAYQKNQNKNICTIIKHNIPCGAAIHTSQLKSYHKALAGDSLSAFGGIVAFNKKVTAKTANLLSKNFYEVIAAPDFEKEALKILSQKKNLRVLKVKNANNRFEKKTFFGGELIQEKNNKTSNFKSINGKKSLNNNEFNFFINILKNIKSNTIAIFDNNSLLAQSGGQTSRIDALQNCLLKLKQKHPSSKKSKLFLFSDAFFPFTDSLTLIKKEKLNIDILAPLGSINDDKIVKFVKNNKINFFQLSDRHFKH